MDSHPPAAAVCGSSPAETQTKFESKHWLSDSEVLAFGIPPSAVDSFRRHRYQQAFAVSSWYPAIETHTFQSDLVALSYREIEVLLKANNSMARQRSQRAAQHRADRISQPEGSQKEREVKEEEDDWHVDLTAEEVKVMEELQGKLDNAIVKFSVGAFIKLDTRSPKDVVIDRSDDPENTAKVREFVKEGLVKAVERERQEEDRIVKVFGSWDNFLLNQGQQQLCPLNLCSTFPSR